MLPDLHLLEPIWRSKTSRRESVLFVAEDAGHPATGKLLFPATRILAIHSADGQTQFELGKDVELSPDGRTLILLKDSRIPHLQASDLFPPAGAPHSIPHKTGDPAKHLLFDNGHWFHDQQIEVTYEHDAATWPGPTPAFAGERLPNVLAKLRAGKPLSLAVSGDSIAAGGNASGVTKTPPWMPAFPELVAAQLEKTYKSDVTLHNRAVGGWTAPQGAGDLDALLAAKPDLVIIAYGMNDVGYRDPDAFGKTICRDARSHSQGQCRDGSDSRRPHDGPCAVGPHAARDVPAVSRCAGVAHWPRRRVGRRHLVVAGNAPPQAGDRPHRQRREPSQ